MCTDHVQGRHAIMRACEALTPFPPIHLSFVMLRSLVRPLAAAQHMKILHVPASIRRRALQPTLARATSSLESRQDLRSAYQTRFGGKPSADVATKTRRFYCWEEQPTSHANTSTSSQPIQHTSNFFQERVPFGKLWSQRQSGSVVDRKEKKGDPTIPTIICLLAFGGGYYLYDEASNKGKKKWKKRKGKSARLGRAVGRGVEGKRVRGRDSVEKQ